MTKLDECQVRQYSFLPSSLTERKPSNAINLQLASICSSFLLEKVGGFIAKSRKLKPQKTLIPLAMAFPATIAQAAEISGEVTLTSDYYSHGLSQTAGNPAIQGGIDLGFENGFYVGVWGSNVDWGDDANLEIDYYAGYKTHLTTHLDLDIRFKYYTFPGYNTHDIDYTEVIAGLQYNNFAFNYGYAHDYINSGESVSFISVDYSYAINEHLYLDLHAGHNFGAGLTPEYDSFEDYSIGFSGQVSGLDLSVAYLFNSLDIQETANYAEDALVFTVSRSF